MGVASIRPELVQVTPVEPGTILWCPAPCTTFVLLPSFSIYSIIYFLKTLLYIAYGTEIGTVPICTHLVTLQR